MGREAPPPAGPGGRSSPGLIAGLLLAFLAASNSQAGGLTPEEAEIRARLEAASAEMVATLRRWVELNTGTGNGPGLERLAGILRARLEALEFAVDVIPGAPLELPGSAPTHAGPLLVARREARVDPADARRLMLVGHYDTVFEPTSGFREFRLDPDAPGQARGPGVADMKGGLVVLFFVLGELARTGDLDRASWTVLFNGDEEIGSLTSRPRIEQLARTSELGFVFEAAGPNGAMVRSRRGLGQFHLQVEGVAAHAGGAHVEGRSAIRELAEKVLRIEALTDYDRGVTLNVGTFRGGRKRNIVPAHAEAWIDLRYDRAELGEEIERALRQVARENVVEGTTARLWGTLHRPPKPADASTLELLDQYSEVARALGVELPDAVHAGGGTDGSLMSAVGLPTLDSMGVRGGNVHTEREFAVLDSLPERAALAAILFRRLIEGRFTR